MKRLLNADPVFWGILDAEARLLGCSSPAVIRCGTLDMIARNNQARIPLFFKDERAISIISDSLRRVSLMITDHKKDPIIQDLLASAPDELQNHLFHAVTLLLESERERLLSPSKNRKDNILNPK